MGTWRHRVVENTLNARNDRCHFLKQNITRTKRTQPEDAQNVQHPNLEWGFSSERVTDAILQQHPGKVEDDVHATWNCYSHNDKNR